MRFLAPRVLAGMLAFVAFQGARVDGQTVLWEHVGSPAALFGNALAGAGDVNSDGVPDVIAGAETETTSLGGLYSGRVYVLSGTDGSVLATGDGAYPSADLGFSVTGPGDVTGDGVPDYVGGGLGGARLFSGATGLPVASLGGYSVAAPGDTNGDGVPDLLGGIPQAGPAGEGMAFVYSGSSLSTLISLTGPATYSYFGGRVGAASDLDGDGMGDLLVGAPGHATLWSGYGAAYAYSGATGTLIGQTSGPPLLSDGFWVAGIGDVTGDGVPDIASSAIDGPSNLSGIVRVYSGATMGLVVTLVGLGEERLGWKLDAAGDVDGDGVPDLIVGAPSALPCVLVGPGCGFAGRAVVYSGAGWNVLYQLTPPAGQGQGLGYGVAGPGDLNDDGFPDLAAGAPGYPNYTSYNPQGIVRAYSGAPIGVASFGQGCPGTSGSPPRIGATGSPRIGTTFAVNLSKTAPGMPTLLLLGFSNADWWGVPLPLNLGFLGMASCDLLVAPHLVAGLATTAFGPGNGRAVSPLALPASPSLVALPFYAQWYVVDPGPAPFPGAMTRGLAITIQA